jgi:hypothetical protein
MIFSEFLFESELKTREDISKAVTDFKNVIPAKKQSVANAILKAAEKFGYKVKSDEILKYDRKLENLNKIISSISDKLNIPIEKIKHKISYNKMHSFEIETENILSKKDIEKLIKDEFYLDAFIVHRLKDMYVTNFSIKKK